MRTYDNIQKIANYQLVDYTTDCLLDYHYFRDYDSNRFKQTPNI